MKLTSTCVVEHQNMAARNLSNSAVIWGQMTWAQKRKIAPGQGGSCCCGDSNSTSNGTLLDVIIGGSFLSVFGGVVVLGLGCCCISACVEVYVKCARRVSRARRVPRARHAPLNAQEEPQVQDLEDAELEEIAIDPAEQEQTAVLAVIQPDEPVQLKIVSTDTDIATPDAHAYCTYCDNVAESTRELSAWENKCIASDDFLLVNQKDTGNWFICGKNSEDKVVNEKISSSSSLGKMLKGRNQEEIKIVSDDLLDAIEDYLGYESDSATENSSSDVELTTTDQATIPTEQNPLQRSLDGSATWVESPKEQGSSLKNVY